MRAPLSIEIVKGKNGNLVEKSPNPMKKTEEKNREITENILAQ